MPANRTSGRLFLELIETRIERDRLQMEVHLLEKQLRRHSGGELQIREARRLLANLRPHVDDSTDSPRPAP